MYFLGKDVIHPAGNQLIKYGFKKSPSQGLKGTSCYRLDEPSGVIELYGSCASTYSEDSKLVFLRERCRFYHWLPNHPLIAGQWSADKVDVSTPQDILASLTPLLQWRLAYEAWIEENHGSGYRKQCYREWAKIKSKANWLPPELATQWINTFLEQQGQTPRPKQLLSKKAI